MNRRMVRRGALSLGFITWAAAFAPLHAADSEAFQDEGIDVSSLSTDERQALAEEMRVFLQARVDGDERIDGQVRVIHVKVSIADAENRVVIDLGRGYIPAFDGYDLEQLIHGLSTEIDDFLRGKGLSYRTDIYFGDMSIDEYHRIEDAKVHWVGMGVKRSITLR